jgi:hypothetical protein
MRSLSEITKLTNRTLSAEGDYENNKPRRHPKHASNGAGVG